MPAFADNTIIFYQTYSLIAGSSRPRIQRRDLPIASELDWLCLLLDDLSCLAPESARYVRLGVDWGQGGVGPGAMLATMSRRRIYDAGGRLCEVNSHSLSLHPVTRCRMQAGRASCRRDGQFGQVTSRPVGPLVGPVDCP